MNAIGFTVKVFDADEEGDVCDAGIIKGFSVPMERNGDSANERLADCGLRFGDLDKEHGDGYFPVSLQSASTLRVSKGHAWGFCHALDMEQAPAWCRGLFVSHSVDGVCELCQVGLGDPSPAFDLPVEGA